MKKKHENIKTNLEVHHNIHYKKTFVREGKGLRSTWRVEHVGTESSHIIIDLLGILLGQTVSLLKLNHKNIFRRQPSNIFG